MEKAVTFALRNREKAVVLREVYKGRKIGVQLYWAQILRKELPEIIIKNNLQETKIFLPLQSQTGTDTASQKNKMPEDAMSEGKNKARFETGTGNRNCKNISQSEMPRRNVL